MAEAKPIKDSARAIDATDLLARARRRARIRLVWQVIGWAVVIVLVVLAWRCLDSILNYSGQTEVPTAATEEEQ